MICLHKYIIKSKFQHTSLEKLIGSEDYDLSDMEMKLLSQTISHCQVRASLQLCQDLLQLLLIGAIVGLASLLQNESRDQTEVQ